MNTQQDKAILYSGGGLVDEKTRAAPLKSEERHHLHRAIEDCLCYDCGNLIEKRHLMCVSTVTVTQGIKAQTFTMQIHPECYNVVGQVMAIVPVEVRTLWGCGRPSLRDMWAKHRELIEHHDDALAAMLKGAFDG